MKYILNIIFLIFFFSCSEKRIEMTDIEKHYAELYKAEFVSVTLNNTQTETNGVLEGKRDYYLIEITNSDSLNQSFENESLFNLETKKIAQILADNIKTDGELDLTEIQVDIISDKGFLIFNNSKNKSIIYYQTPRETE